jgi:hypothetical protein
VPVFVTGAEPGAVPSSSGVEPFGFAVAKSLASAGTSTYLQCTRGN